VHYWCDEPHAACSPRESIITFAEPRSQVSRCEVGRTNGIFTAPESPAGLPELRFFVPIGLANFDLFRSNSGKRDGLPPKLGVINDKRISRHGRIELLAVLHFDIPGRPAGIEIKVDRAWKEVTLAADEPTWPVDMSGPAESRVVA
jgi:hypothetical protein